MTVRVEIWTVEDGRETRLAQASEHTSEISRMHRIIAAKVAANAAKLLTGDISSSQPVDRHLVAD
jgi:RNA 3'-terminal phosphate cyclase